MSPTFPDPSRSIFSKEDAFFHVALSLLLVSLFLSYGFLITYGTGNFFGYEFLGNAFDAIGEQFLTWHVGIDASVARWESFKLDDGRLVMYFGPFPGLLRLIANLFFPALHGRWSRLSVLFASAATVLAALSIVLLALSHNSSLRNSTKKIVALLSLVGFGFGTPVFFLVSCCFIYHEANIWGLTCAMWGLYILLRLLLNEGNVFTNLHLLAWTASATLLSRITFGVPQYLLLAFVTIAIYFHSQIVRPPASSIGISPVDTSDKRLIQPALLFKLVLLLSPAIVALGVQLWYNHARFGSVLTFADYTRYTAALDQHSPSIEKIGGMMNVRRIPFGLYNYFRIKPEHFNALPPHFHLQPVEDFTPGTYPHGFENGPKMNVISLVIVSPWLLLGSTIGFFRILQLRGEKALLWLASSAILLTQILFITSYYWITTRYSSEFLPLLLILYVAFLISANEPQRALWKNLQIAVLTVLVSFSVLATAGSTLEYTSEYRFGVPQEYVKSLHSKFRTLRKYESYIVAWI